MKLALERCMVTTQVAGGLVLVLPRPDGEDTSWRFRLCRIEEDGLRVLDDHVHAVTALTLGGKYAPSMGEVVDSQFVLGARDLGLHPETDGLPEALVTLDREMLQARRQLGMSECLDCDWDGSSVMPFRFALGRSFENGDPGDSITFTAGDSYVQVLVNPESRVVYGEASNTEGWENGPPLTQEQHRQLTALGWSQPFRPFQVPNYARLWIVGPRCSLDDVARDLAVTLSSVYGVQPTARLEIEVAYNSRSLPGPDVRFPNPAAVAAGSRESLREGGDLCDALASPERRYCLGDVADMAELGAAMLVAFNRDRPLSRDNEWAAIAFTEQLLSLNGYRIEGDDTAVADLARRVAGKLDETEAADALRPLIASGAAELPFSQRYPAGNDHGAQ